MMSIDASASTMVVVLESSLLYSLILGLWRPDLLTGAVKPRGEETG
jgi:hypothetical protein